MSQEKELTGYPSIDKPWLKYYSKEAIDAPLSECTIYEYLYENNKDYPSDIAINYLGRKISYKELFENIDKTAAAFLKIGVKEKEIVTVALPSIPEALYCIYALNKIGAVSNMVHPLAGREETLFYFNEVQSRIAVIFDGAYAAIADDIGNSSVEKVIVASPSDSLPVALRVAYKLKVKAPFLDGNVFQSWKTFFREGKNTPVKAVKKDCHEMAIISHTGGTTGEPKGVMCSDKSVNAIIWSLLKSTQHERQQRFLVQLPPFINYSLVNSMLEPLSCGVTLYLIPDYKPAKIGYYLKKCRPNHINSIPPYVEAMLKAPEIKTLDLSFLINLSVGGDGMSKESETLINTLLAERGSKTRLAKGYGMTELISCATFTYEGSNAVGCIGIPLVKINCKIIDSDTNQELSYGESGEICFAGETLMLGYYHNPKATEDLIKLHQDGLKWLHTGDLGYMNENGQVFVTGRIKRIILTKGRDGQVTKLVPDRIEKDIYSHPAVELCCVVGVPDQMRINYPKAFVVVKDKGTDKNSITEEILQICRENLPDYMVPDEIEYRDDLPRTPRGKIDYRALEETAKET